MPSAEDLKKADESGARIFLLSIGKNEDGEDQYTYISVLPSKLIPFKEAEAKGGFYYEDFGEILASGIGSEPTEEVKQMMEKKHGFNHNFEGELFKKAEEIENKKKLVEKYTKPKKDEW